MSQASVLIVEDEKHQSDIIKHRLEKIGYSVFAESTVDSAIEQLKAREFEVVLLDIMLSGKGGLEVLRHVSDSSALSEVIIVTASNSLDVAVEGIRLGAFDYIAKPIDFVQLEKSIKRAVEKNLTARQQLAVHRLSRGRFPLIISQSDSMKKALYLVDKSSQTDSAVLILGETGTGKELIARTIHFKSNRSKDAFIALNCAGLPEALIESELFGHEKGAFTGASEMHRGLFEIAHKGTLFMDEIAEMSLATQSKLLRVLESGEFRRIGGRSNLYTDVRLVAATNKTITDLVIDGRFREDLYYRLNTIVINLPPLRDRKQDIEPLARYFLNALCQETGRSKDFSQDVIKVLEQYSWPGNVRELRNLIERLVLISEKNIIELDDLPEETTAFRKKSFIQAEDITLAELEKQHILRILNKTGGNKRAAAKILGVSEMTLYRKLKEYPEWTKLEKK